MSVFLVKSQTTAADDTSEGPKYSPGAPRSAKWASPVRRAGGMVILQRYPKTRRKRMSAGVRVSSQ